MSAIQIFGLICGCIALLFSIVAALTYFKIKKLFSIIDESQLEAVESIIEKQKRRVYVETLISGAFAIATVVLAVINIA